MFCMLIAVFISQDFWRFCGVVRMPSNFEAGRACCDLGYMTHERECT